MKLKFQVNEHTLIPREDTEILVQKAIEICGDAKVVAAHTHESVRSETRYGVSVHSSVRQYEDSVRHTTQLKVLDMCTGSGCIAISIAKYVQNALVDAVDISKEALEVAKENAIQNQVDVNFIHSNLFENVNGQYDMIVSNPPYIVSSEINQLQREVQKEPKIALDGGIDGLVFYQEIAKEAISFLKPNGILLFEIGFDQGKAVTNILQENGYQEIEVIQDLSGNDRVIVSRYTMGTEEFV